jgi:hypothetical protein
MTLSFRDQKMMMSYIEELPDHPPNVAAIREYAEKFIMPNEDANFLRASNPATSGKLLFNALMRREETNLDFANKNFDLFSMCHLYNALRQLGYLSESWHALDNYIDLHIKTIFLGERPKASAQIMANRAFLSGGLHPEVVRQFTNPDNRTKNPLRLMKKKTNRTGKFALSPFMTMLSDYLHDKETISRTLQRMDEEMVAQLERVLVGVKVPKSKSPFKSYMNDMGPLPFLVGSDVCLCCCVALSMRMRAFLEHVGLRARLRQSCWSIEGVHSGGREGGTVLEVISMEIK